LSSLALVKSDSEAESRLRAGEINCSKVQCTPGRDSASQILPSVSKIPEGSVFTSPSGFACVLKHILPFRCYLLLMRSIYCL